MLEPSTVTITALRLSALSDDLFRPGAVVFVHVWGRDEQRQGAFLHAELVGAIRLDGSQAVHVAVRVEDVLRSKEGEEVQSLVTNLEVDHRETWHAPLGPALERIQQCQGGLVRPRMFSE